MNHGCSNDITLGKSFGPTGSPVLSCDVDNLYNAVDVNRTQPWWMSVSPCALSRCIQYTSDSRLPNDHLMERRAG